MKRRRRSWLASRAEKASSSRSSMRLSASPSRPTSVRGSVVSTRCERSPPAIAAAVWPMRSSGSRPTRTTIRANPPTSASTPAITIPSTSSSCSKRLVGGRQRERDDGRGAAAGIGRGEHAVVAAGGLDRLGLADAQVGRQVRALAAVVGAEEVGLEDLPGGVAALAVGVRRRAAAGQRPAAAAAGTRERPALVAVELVLQRAGGADELRVDAVEQEVALRRVGDRADEQHPGRGQHEHAGDQPPAQRGDHARGARSV